MVDRFCQPFSSNTSRNKGRIAHVGSKLFLNNLWTTFVQNALANLEQRELPLKEVSSKVFQRVHDDLRNAGIAFLNCLDHCLLLIP